jgi:hypothetical protein
MRFHHLFAPLTLLIAASTGHAAVIVFPGTAINFSGAVGIFSASGSLPLFDPALGTLTSVSFQIMDSTSVIHRYENFSSFPPSAAGSDQTVVTVLFNGPTTLASANSSGSVSGAATTTFDGVLDFGLSPADTSGFTSTVGAVYAGAGTGFGDPASYVGVGTFGVTIQRTASQAGLSAPGGFVIANNDANSVVNYSVTYNFVPIPEPDSVSLVALAAAGMLLRCRRRI